MHYQPKQDLLNDRIILVTGASDGIGREAAMTYARYGATVILLGRNEEKLRQVASHINEETGRQPQWFILDLLTCTSEDCQQLAQRIAVNYPRLDGVLHNAAGMLLVTHDMGVVARLADDVAVMSHGKIVEQGDVETLFNAPKHAVTRSLVSAHLALYGMELAS